MMKNKTPTIISSSVPELGTAYFPGLNLCPQFRQMISNLLAPMAPPTNPVGPATKAPAEALPKLKPFLLADREVEPHFGQQAIPKVL